MNSIKYETLCRNLAIFSLSHFLVGLTESQPASPCSFLPRLIPPSLLFMVSLRAVRPRLWRERRRVMFGLSVWLLVSVSGAAGSSDSAGGAAGPSRVQPSPCDTLSVTDPLCLVTWHPPPPPSFFFFFFTCPSLPPSWWPFHCHSAVSHSSQSLTASLRTL